MRISFLEPHLNMTGGIRRIIEISNALVRRGNDVSIYHSDGSPCDWLDCHADIRPYKDALKTEHEVLVINHYRDAKMMDRASSRLKVYYLLHNQMLTEKHNRKVYKSLRKDYYQVVNATWLRNWLREEYGNIPPVLFGGINRDLFRPVDIARADGAKTVVAIGDTKYAWKGFQTVREAIEIAREKDPSIELTTCSGLGLTQEKMDEFYCSGDVFVDAHWHAGWNNPVAEAMACGVPVVCTDIGGVHDLVFHEKTGLLVPVNDPGALAESILRILNDKPLAEKLRSNALKHVEVFDYDKSAAYFERILERELADREKNSSLGRRIGKFIKKRLKMRPRKNIVFNKYEKKGAYHWDIYGDKTDPVYVEHVDTVVSMFNGGGTLLDIGCGDGLISHKLAEKGYDVTGIDSNKTAIKLAETKSGNARFICKDLFDLNEKYDYTLASEVIEHIADPAGLLNIVKSLTRKEALITTPLRNYYGDMDEYHYKEYCQLELEGLLQKHFSTFEITSSENHLYARISMMQGG